VVKGVSAGNNVTTEQEALEGIVRVLLSRGQPLTISWTTVLDGGDFRQVTDYEVIEGKRSLDSKNARAGSYNYIPLFPLE